MDEANRCDRVALMQRGKILAIDTPDAITKAFDRPLLAIKTPGALSHASTAAKI